MPVKKYSSERLLNKYPIAKSLKTVFITVFLIPVTILSIFLVVFLYNTLLSWEMDKVNLSFTHTEQTFNQNLNELQTFSQRLALNKMLEHILITEYKTPEDFYDDYDKCGFINDYLINWKEVASFRIYAKNQSIQDTEYFIKVTDVTQNALWYNRAIVMEEQGFWTYKKDPISNKYYLSYIHSLCNSKNKEFIGVAVINLNPDVVLKDLSKQIFETTIFHDNQILYSSSENFTVNEKKLLLQFLNNEERSRKLKRFTLHGENIGVVFEAFSPLNQMEMDFVILYIIPIKQLKKATGNTIIVVAVILTVMIILSITMIIIYSQYIDRRVYRVQDGIYEISNKNFDIPSSIGGKDEFEQIYNTLFEMSQNMKDLINVVYTQKIEKEHISAQQNEMNFKMLSTQINPHFLFNTLETIRMKSLSTGEKDVATMLKLLASLLRYNLTVKGQLVPLSKEIEAIQNYLNIQHMRFGERVSYDVSTMCDIQSIQILPLLIQPLVENSFSHGLENKVAGGFIYILINCEVQNNKQVLTISVKDNGCGMSEEKLESLWKNIKNDSNTSSIGVANVYSRIKLFYEKGSGMEIESEEGEGTTVTLKLISNI